MATVAFIAWIVRGPYGRAITAMRDEELAFTALGRNAMSMKIALFAIGCGIAGIAGGLYAFYFQYLSPEQFDVLQSAAILTMVVLGGMGTTWGPVVGAALLLAVPQAITFLDLPPSIMAPMQGIIFTGLVLLFLFLRPAGLIGASGRGEMPAALAVHDHSGEGGMTEILRLSGVCKAFGGIVVADDVNLSIEAGEILGLIGPNGAGKTSLFNLISGVVRPDAGQIVLQGEPIDRMKLYRRARAGIARTWQNMLLFASMSVMENLLIAPRHYPGESVLRLAFGRAEIRRTEAELRARGQAILARMELTQAADSMVIDLPFGHQKLVGLARTLMNDGALLLLDEPMAGVEGAAYETMQRIVREEAAAGRAVCVVEHNVSFIKDLCTRAVFMAQGRILQTGSVDELLASKVLTDLYFGV